MKPWVKQWWATILAVSILPASLLIAAYLEVTRESAADRLVNSASTVAEQAEIVQATCSQTLVEVKARLRQIEKRGS